MQKFAPIAASKRRMLIMIATVAMLAYLGVGFAVDSGRIVTATWQLGVGGCSLVLVLSLINYGIRCQRWQIFIGKLGHRLPLARHVLFYLSGFAFTVSPGKAGEAVRSLYLRDYGVSYGESIAALFVERLQDVLAMALLASLAALDRPAYRPLVVGALLLVLSVLAVVSFAAAPVVLQKWSSRVRGRRLAMLLDGVATLLSSSRALLSPGILTVSTAIGILSWGGEGLGFYLICQGLQLPISVSAAIGIYALAVLAGSAAVFLPAGLGGMELVMTSLLVAHGASIHLAVVATLLCRVATLWFAVLIGIVAATAVEMNPHTTAIRSTP